jgi:hypothetical protein
MPARFRDHRSLPRRARDTHFRSVRRCQPLRHSEFRPVTTRDWAIASLYPLHVAEASKKVLMRLSCADGVGPPDPSCRGDLEPHVRLRVITSEVQVPATGLGEEVSRAPLVAGTLIAAALVFGGTKGEGCRHTGGRRGGTLRSASPKTSTGTWLQTGGRQQQMPSVKPSGVRRGPDDLPPRSTPAPRCPPPGVWWSVWWSRRWFRSAVRTTQAADLHVSSALGGTRTPNLLIRSSR